MTHDCFIRGLYGICLLAGGIGVTMTLPLVHSAAREPAQQTPQQSVPKGLQDAALDVAPKDAKTVQVTMTTWRAPRTASGDPGELRPVRKSVIRIDRAANRAKFEEYSLPADTLGDISAFDGTTSYEYILARKQYRKVEGGSLSVGLTGRMYNIALGLSLGWKSSVPGTFRSAPDETLEGKPMKVYSRTYPVTQNNVTSTYQQKFYVDPTTRLPVRYSLTITAADGNVHEVSRATLSDWKLDAPIEAAQLTWSPPADATEYKAPPATGQPNAPASL
jgi:hypothetical protein